MELTNGSYLKHIAPARTFGSREDEQAMRNMGLIRGASQRKLHRAHAGWSRERAAALSDEFVRHKVLDLVGDLALLGSNS